MSDRSRDNVTACAENFKVRGGWVHSPQPSTKNSDGIEKFTMTGSVDGHSVLPETQFVGARLHMDTTQVLSVGDFLPLWELPERGHNLTSLRL